MLWAGTFRTRLRISPPSSVCHDSVLHVLHFRARSEEFRGVTVCTRVFPASACLDRAPARLLARASTVGFLVPFRWLSETYARRSLPARGRRSWLCVGVSRLTDFQVYLASQAPFSEPRHWLAFCSYQFRGGPRETHLEMIRPKRHLETLRGATDPAMCLFAQGL